MKTVLRYLRWRIWYPAWSCAANVFWWLQHADRERWSAARKWLAWRKERLRGATTPTGKYIAIADTVRFVRNKYTPEKVDWRPWLVTLVARHGEDDCDGAAVLGRWAFEQAGMPAEYAYLFGPTAAHLIAVTRDRELVVTNDWCVRIPKCPGKSWQDAVLEDLLGGVYTEMWPQGA